MSGIAPGTPERGDGMTTDTQHQDVVAALREATRLLPVDAAAAERAARSVLDRYPDADPAQLVLAAARRRQGDIAAALDILRELVARQPDSADAQCEYGLALGAAGRGAEALVALRRATEIAPRHGTAWRALGDQLAAAGDAAGSEAAFARHLEVSAEHPEVIEAARLAAAGELARAETLARELLKRHPTDVNAIRLLAEIGIRVGQFDDAQKLLERCLELAPDFHVARHNYASLLYRRQRLPEALAQVERLLAAEPNNPNFRLLQGTVLVQKGDHVPALAIYEELLADYPNQPAAHMNYGHTLKTVGRVDDAVAAYRQNVALARHAGEAWWSLANLKTFRFTDADLDAMRARLADDGDPDDQAHLHFALGKAYEDRADYDTAFGHYEKGNAIRRRQHRYNPKVNVFDTARQIKTLDREFFAAREGWGCPAPDPVFIVGLPRAGSTLLEQILASHSLVEGTAELPDIIAISRRLGRKSRKNPASLYPEVLARLTADECRALGEGYLASTRVQRHGLPYFIDKMPNNFQHIGLIHLLLPNARIIDARRHPLAGCFSCYKQLFARGQTFTYDLRDLGHYYRDYVRLMDHWDDVLPGRVLRVHYEDVVADTEGQVRRLLEYCGLPFEDACLRFWETERAVRTPSSEQVRQPVYSTGVAQWRHFDAHLRPLKDALGPLLERYPAD